MKKLAFLLLAGGMFISSCKKTYSCTCVDSTATGGGTTVYEVPNSTQQEAATFCAAEQVYIQGNTQERTCKL